MGKGILKSPCHCLLPAPSHFRYPVLFGGQEAAVTGCSGWPLSISECLRGISHLKVHWGDQSVKVGGFFTSKLAQFPLMKNCPEFLTTTRRRRSYFYLTFLLSLWPTAIPIVQKNSRVLHRISTDVSTEKLCAENSLFHVYSCPEMTKFKFTFKK